MMISRGLFGWSPPHVQPLTPVSEVSEPPESPLPDLQGSAETVEVEDEELIDYNEDIEPPPAAVPFLRLLEFATALDWFLMIVGSLAAAAHGAALVVYLHFFGKIINLLGARHLPPGELFDQFTELTLRSRLEAMSRTNVNPCLQTAVLPTTCDEASGSPCTEITVCLDATYSCNGTRIHLVRQIVICVLSALLVFGLHRVSTHLQ